jgi:ammonium transporter, Amt family
MALGASDDAAAAILNTHAAACASAGIWAAIERFKTGKISALGIATGALAGLAAISAAAVFVWTTWAIVIGLFAGASSYFVASFIKHRFAIDDAMNIFAVHGTGGIIGTLLVGVFMSEKLGGGGLPEGTSVLAQLGIQSIGALLVVLWSVIGTLIVGYGLAMVLPMRADDEDSKGA